LQEQGKDINDFPMVFVSLVGKAVRSGRRLCGQERSQDVLSPVAQRRHGFVVESLPARTAVSLEQLYGEVAGQRRLDAYEERLRDNTRTPPPKAAAFRIDWPAFLCSLTARDQDLALFLSLGHKATTAAQTFKLSAGRVTQLRQRWCQQWRRCQGEEAAEEAGTRCLGRPLQS
jgi:hypothetical protein